MLSVFSITFRELLPQMKKWHGGKVVFISSRADYATINTLETMVNCLRRELQNTNVRMEIV